MNKLRYIIILLLFDLFLSNLFLKNTKYWEVPDWKDKHWRVSSDIYHHKIKPNVKEIESWGGKFTKTIITNSIGFIDKNNRNIKKINSQKKRILLIGDSFIEGSGLDYEYTFAGLLNDHLGENFEILNSAVGSYSPSIYFKKTEYYINEGYKFDQAIIFLDVSDVFDELFIEFDSMGNIKTYKETKKQSALKKYFYKTGNFLRDNMVTFRFLNITSDKAELIKNYIKLKKKAAKNFGKGFFETSRDDVMFYRMTHIDRGYWTFNEKNFLNIKDGLKQSEKYLDKLFTLLKDNNISSTLVIYPWPTQILYGDNYHEDYWKNFSVRKNVNYLSVYDSFSSSEKKKFIFDNFLYGDVHWSKKGTKKIFDNIVKNIRF